MRRSLLYGVPILFAVLALLLWSGTVHAPTFLPPAPSSNLSVTLRTGKVAARVADTPAERAQGLSGVPNLAEDEGLLFIFANDGRYGFWMKDMKISIDIIWLSADKRVVHMAQNAAPESYPRSFTPEKEARFVLEVPAGWAKRHGVQKGDQAQW